jgi:MFS family permease
VYGAVAASGGGLGLLLGGALTSYASWRWCLYVNLVFAAIAITGGALLPPRVILDRNRGGAYLTMLITGAGIFGIFLFLIYYMQENLGYSPVKSGVALLPMVAVIGVTANVGNIKLVPRLGPKPLIGLGLLVNAVGLAWLTRIGVHSDYASALLGPLIVTGFGSGLIFSAAANTGTFGVASHDAGIASASVNTEPRSISRPGCDKPVLRAICLAADRTSTPPTEELSCVPYLHHRLHRRARPRRRRCPHG